MRSHSEDCGLLPHYCCAIKTYFGNEMYDGSVTKHPTTDGAAECDSLQDFRKEKQEYLVSAPSSPDHPAQWWRGRWSPNVVATEGTSFMSASWKHLQFSSLLSQLNSSNCSSTAVHTPPEE